MTDVATKPTRAEIEVEVKEKINEMFAKDTKADPRIAERVAQIANDAIASMPPDPPVEPKETPEQVMLRKLKEEVDKIAANTDVPKEMADKVKQLPGIVEAALKGGDKPKVKAAEPAKASEPEHAHANAKHK